MLNKYLTRVFFGICLLMMTTNATTQSIVKVPIDLGSCGSPTEQVLRCLGQWSCQQAIRLDLRCLLNLNGTPLLGGLLGGSGLLNSLTGGVTGGANSGGGGGGGGGGILGGLLGR